MDKTAAVRRSTIVQSLLRCVKDEAGVGSPARPPTDDPARISVDDERDADEPGPGRDVGEVRPRAWRVLGRRAVG